jgi:hypothetical protein
MATLTLLSYFGFLENLFFRSIAGGSVGGLTASYMKGVTPTLSFIESSINGNFGFGGYFMLSMLTLMLFVWFYNLFRGRGIVQ